MSAALGYRGHVTATIRASHWPATDSSAPRSQSAAAVAIGAAAGVETIGKFVQEFVPGMMGEKKSGDSSGAGGLRNGAGTAGKGMLKLVTRREAEAITEAIAALDDFDSKPMPAMPKNAPMLFRMT